MWLYIAAVVAIPVILVIAVWYRLWLYGEDAQNAPQSELNPDINLHITRLDLECTPTAKPVQAPDDSENL